MINDSFSINFCAEKNKKLKEERNISFEEIIAILDSEQHVNIIEHPNQSLYPNQKMYAVEINSYIYLVPFVKDIEGNVFLKTIFPSRKATKIYTQEVVTNE